MNTKILFLGVLISILSFSSCSEDDSSTTSIQGTWQPIAEVDVCSTGSKEIYEFSNCEKMSRTTFSENGVLNITEYEDNTGNCQEDFNEKGTWSLSGSNLSITIDGETLNPTFFELSGNTLRIGYYDNDPNDLCDGENLSSHYYTEFKKVD